MHVCLYANISTYVQHTCMHVLIHTFRLLHVCLHIHTCLPTYIYIYMYRTYIHACTHTYIPSYLSMSVSLYEYVKEVLEYCINIHDVLDNAVSKQVRNTAHLLMSTFNSASR